MQWRLCVRLERIGRSAPRSITSRLQEACFLCSEQPGERESLKIGQNVSRPATRGVVARWMDGPPAGRGVLVTVMNEDGLAWRRENVSAGKGWLGVISPLACSGTLGEVDGLAIDGECGSWNGRCRIAERAARRGEMLSNVSSRETRDGGVTEGRETPRAPGHAAALVTAGLCAVRAERLLPDFAPQGLALEAGILTGPAMAWGGPNRR